MLPGAVYDADPWSVCSYERPQAARACIIGSHLNSLACHGCLICCQQSCAHSLAVTGAIQCSRLQQSKSLTRRSGYAGAGV